MIDINKHLRMVVKTGKVNLGCKEAVFAAKSGKAKLIILASNCPEPYRSDILYNAKLSEVPVFTFTGTSHDLASACEKPFVIAALTVREPGDSEILKLTAT